MNTMIAKIGTTKVKRIKTYLTKKETIVFIISGLFILLFLYAAANKLMDFQKFEVQIGQSPILTGYAMPIACLIPSIEIIICLMLTFKRTLLAGLYASFGLMVMFTAYIIVILNFSAFVPCSCGGILEKLGWNEHLAFNVAFVILSVIGILLQSTLQEKNYVKPQRYSFAQLESGRAENR